MPDSDVLAYATMHGRAVITLNRRDFIRLHQERPEHDGIIVCTPEPDANVHARRIHDAITQHGALQGRLLRVNRPPS